MFTQQAFCTALIFALRENQKITIYQLVGEVILVHRAYFLEYHYFCDIKFCSTSYLFITVHIFKNSHGKKEIGCRARHLKYISILQEFSGDIKSFTSNQNRAFHNEVVSN